MSSEKKQKISRATMTRFPVYLKALRVMGHEGKENFLSSELAEVTHIQDTTIRRDFGFLPQKNTLGKRGYGYDTKEMIETLSDFLGLGLIVCAYDKDANIEGERFGVKIHKSDDLEKTFPKDCKIAILAISDNVQEMVDRLVALGIKGIVDFTHSHFIVPQGVEVQNVDVVVAIQELELKMKSNTKE